MQPGLRVCLEAQGAQQSRHRTRWKVTNATIRNQLYNLNGLGQLQGYVWHLPATCMRNSSSPQDHIQCPVSLYNEVPSLSCKWWFCASGVLLDSRLRLGLLYVSHFRLLKADSNMLNCDAGADGQVPLFCDAHESKAVAHSPDSFLLGLDKRTKFASLIKLHRNRGARALQVDAQFWAYFQDGECHRSLCLPQRAPE